MEAPAPAFAHVEEAERRRRWENFLVAKLSTGSCCQQSADEVAVQELSCWLAEYRQHDCKDSCGVLADRCMQVQQHLCATQLGGS